MHGTYPWLVWLYRQRIFITPICSVPALCKISCGSSDLAPLSRDSQCIHVQQSATASILHIRVEKRFDPELGIVIGERTDIKRIERRLAAPVPEPARVAPEPPRPAMYGIGLKVADSPPHTILSVTDLRDGQGKNINSQIQPKDTLEAINDCSVKE